MTLELTVTIFGFLVTISGVVFSYGKLTQKQKDQCDVICQLREDVRELRKMFMERFVAGGGDDI